MYLYYYFLDYHYSKHDLFQIKFWRKIGGIPTCGIPISRCGPARCHSILILHIRPGRSLLISYSVRYLSFWPYETEDRHQTLIDRSFKTEKDIKSRRGSCEPRTTATVTVRRQSETQRMTDTTDSGDEDDDGLALSTIFTVSRSIIMYHAQALQYIYFDDTFNRQEPPRPPSPEPTTAIYENIIITTTTTTTTTTNHEDNHDPDLSLVWNWSTISLRLVGSHPLWGHYLYVQFTWDIRDTHQRT